MKEEIMCTGHGDMIEDANGNWWMVCLGIRPITNEKRRVLLHNLGRETFLTPVKWKDGWPVVGIPGKEGMIGLKMEGPLPGIPEETKKDFFDDFSGPRLSLEYNYLRNPKDENYCLSPEEKKLTLYGTKETLSRKASPTFLGIRQREFCTETTVQVEFLEGERNFRAGLTAYYNMSFHYDIFLTKDEKGFQIKLGKQLYDIQAETGCVWIGEQKKVFLKIITDKEFYTFYYSLDQKDYICLGKGLTAGLCTEVTDTMTFTGVYLGMFVENGKADFKKFSMQVL